jgi:SAM-dependent methyltransferase
MKPDDLFELVQRLNGPMEALAALAAELRIQTDGLVTDPRLAEALQEVVQSLGVDPAALAALPPAQKRAAAGGIHAFLRHAVDLIEHPDRAPGWAYTETQFLQSQGRMSMPIANVLLTIAPTLGDLSVRLAGGQARFLDVGTGVGWLAIAMANTFPGLSVVGLDVFEPALAIGRQNIAEASLEHRIELRKTSVVDLRDKDAFDLAFIAGPFLPEAIVPEALARVRDALRPGGVLLFATFATVDDPVAKATQALRIVRSGGHAWELDQIRALMDAAGLKGAHVVERTWWAPVAFAAGLKTG